MDPGSVIADKYRLIRLLGEGAMGAVWEAENLATGRLFAVKIMSRQIAESPEMHERLLREAKATGRISNRNVVATYDVGRTATGEPFLVMELLRGCALDQYLESRGALPPHEAVTIATEIARGLAAAHAVGIIHRDLKPANIFLHQDPDLGMVVKVVDFGVSKAVDSSTGTITGVAVGSPAYMSPEQARGERGLDARSDVWALGVVLFEMITGRRPFDGESAYDVVAEILKGPIPRLAEVLPGVDLRIDQVVATCLQRDRDARISTAEGVLLALGAEARGTIPSGPQLAPVGAARAAAVKATTTVGQSMSGASPASSAGRRATFAAAGIIAVALVLLSAWGTTRLLRSSESSASAAPGTSTESAPPSAAAPAATPPSPRDTPGAPSAASSSPPPAPSPSKTTKKPPPPAPDPCRVCSVRRGGLCWDPRTNMPC